MKVTLRIPSPREIPYAVKGKTYDEARDFLLSKPFAACYKANPDYTEKHDNDGNTYEIIVTAKPTITIPTWNGASKLKGDEKKHWTAMLAALRKHEAKHHKIFEDDAKAFKKSMVKEDPFPKEDVGGKMYDLFSASQDKQDAYDKKTNHGEKEGVVLP
ncbi:DUF922 domain-containing protein [Marimonas sp. MJW-29]|uniref:DUF922 domain-containing protein n=1 Tax=Sulfitobacter sediminis TaxID=3234186 RepID=A0ABV3RPI9_9RHOB